MPAHQRDNRECQRPHPETQCAQPSDSAGRYTWGRSSWPIGIRSNRDDRWCHHVIVKAKHQQAYSGRLQNQHRLTFFEYYEPAVGSGNFAHSFLGKRDITKILNTSYDWAGGGVVSTNADLAIFLKGIFEGVLAITKMKHRWAFVFHTIFIWIMYVLMFYVTSLSMQEINDISFAPILIGFILGMFSIGATNGGIGTYPEAVVIAFSLFSIAEDPSRAFGWIMWSSQTLMIIIFGGISLLLLPVYNNHRNKTN
mgnify:CR=1 FL=1